MGDIVEILALFKVVAKVLRKYRSVPLVDDRHGIWLEQLQLNRAKRIKESLVQLGVDRRLLSVDLLVDEMDENRVHLGAGIIERLLEPAKAEIPVIRHGWQSHRRAEANAEVPKVVEPNVDVTKIVD